MEYDKMTKAELIEKLREQKHLAQAVEAKDKEIVELKKTLSEKSQQLANSITLDKHKEIVRKEIDEAEKTVELANTVLESHNNAMHLINSALAVINQNEKLLSEKIK